MAYLAIFIAQLLDPVRIIALGLIYYVTSIAPNAGVAWLFRVFGIVAIAAAIPLLIMPRGLYAEASFVVGFFSGAAIIAVIYGLSKLVFSNRRRSG